MKAIGKYQVIDEIGAGPAGATYRVRDTVSEREFALKVLYSSSSASADLKDQFCRGLAAYAELRHPHIAKIQDIGEADGALYVATELLYGIDLRQHLEERRALPLEQKLELIAQVADALTVPHSKGLAHGNLKPGNIFIVAGKNAKVVDLGSGKWLESILASGVKPPALLPNYLAPEQILGQPFDARSDLFALGLILYQLVAGKYPYQVDANLIPREIVHSEPEPVRKLDPEIPEEVERLVARALHKNPQQRLQSAAEFVGVLNDLAQKLRDTRTAAAPPVLAAAPVAPASAPAEKPALAIVAPPTAPAVAAPPAASQAAPVQPAATAEAAPVIAVPRSAAVSTQPAAKPAPAKAAAPQPPKRPVPSAPANVWRRRAIPIAIAGVLAIGIFGTLLSRPNSQASQKKSQAPAIQPNPVTPSAPTTAPPPPVPPPAEAAQAQPARATPATPTVVEVTPAPELILRGKVRSLWESGKYAQAMALVDQILADNPDHAEARAWKKKIRGAQDAEAAIR